MNNGICTAIRLQLSAAFSLCMGAAAADAGFTPDNKHIIQIEPSGRRTLVEIDPATGTAREIFAPLQEEIVAISLDAKDRWILATAKTLWTWKPGEAAPGKLAELPGSEEGRQTKVEDIAADPKSDRILVTASETAPDGSGNQHHAWIYSTGTSEWGEVRCRHLNGTIATPCFNTRGELCFSVAGDLWHGRIEEDLPWSLVAYRYAAVAALFAYNGTPTQSGAVQLACAGDQLVMNHARMGGSGWGTITAIPAPSLDLDTEWRPPDLKAQLATAGKIGASIRELGDGDGYVSFGSSRDGTRAWLHWPRNGKAMVYSGGTVTELEVKLP